MLPYDPIPWLLEQEGLPAVRARRLLHIDLEADADKLVSSLRELEFTTPNAASERFQQVGDAIDFVGWIDDSATFDQYCVIAHD